MYLNKKICNKYNGNDMLLKNLRIFESNLNFVNNVIINKIKIIGVINCSHRRLLINPVTWNTTITNINKPKGIKNLIKLLLITLYTISLYSAINNPNGKQIEVLYQYGLFFKYKHIKIYGMKDNHIIYFFKLLFFIYF